MANKDDSLFSDIKELCRSVGFDYERSAALIIKRCEDDKILRDYILRIGARDEARHHSNEENCAIERGVQEVRQEKARNRDNGVIDRVARRHILDMMLGCNQKLRDCTKEQINAEADTRDSLAEANRRDAVFLRAISSRTPAGKKAGAALSDAEADAIWLKMEKA